MAWTAQAWRYALAGIPDPEADDEQWRYALAGVPLAEDVPVFSGDVSATLGSFTCAFQGEYTEPTQWTYAERLSVVGIPSPGDGFSWTTRAAIANYPGVGLVEGTDRDGDMSFTFGGFASAFDGTVVNVGVDGAVEATLGSFTSSFVGDFTYRHYLDIAYAVTPTWVVTEIPANFGDIGITLSSFGAALDGYALPPDSTQGLMDVTVGSFSAALDGSMTAPASRTGRLSADLQVFNFSGRGTSVAAGGVIGALAPTMGGFTTEFAGTFETWSTDGTLGMTLGGFSADIDGVFISSDTTSGAFGLTMGGFGFDLYGTHDPSSLLNSIDRKQRDNSDLRDQVDGADIRDM